MALKGCGLKRMSSLQGKYRIESLCVDQWIVVLPPAISHFVVFTFPDVIRYNLDSFFFQHHLAGVLKMLTVLKSLWLNLFCCLKNHKFNIVYFQALFLLWCDFQACHAMKTSQFGLNIIQYPVCNILIRSCFFFQNPVRWFLR